MGLVSERINNLLGGVSQKAQAQRDANSLSVAENVVSHPTFGLMTRPPTRHGAVLSADPAPFDLGAFSFPVEQDFNERYRVVVRNGDLLVYDAISGDPVTVSFPDGKDYLDTDGADPLAAFRAVSVDGKTYILNRSRLIQRATERSDSETAQALIVVRSADYATVYTIEIAGQTTSYVTPIGSNAEARYQISTDEIAAEIVWRLNLNSTLSTAGYAFERYGSTIHVAGPGTALDIKVSDSLADEGLEILRTTVPTFDKLPKKAPDGYTIRVLGSPTTSVDDAWYMYDANTSQWAESIKAGEPTEIYAPSMPHQLVSLKELLRNAQHGGPIVNPISVSAGGTAYHGTIAKTLNGSAVVDAGTQVRMGGNFFGAMAGITSIYVNLASVPAAASSVNVRLKYAIDTRDMEGDNVAYVTVYKNDGVSSTTWTQVAQKAYAAKSLYYDEELEALCTAMQQNYDVKITLTYLTAPASAIKDATLTFTQGGTVSGAAVRNPGVTYTTLDLTRVTFPDENYPEGVTYTMTVNATPFAYTPSVPRTGRQMAIAFQALVDADANLVATLSGNSISIDLVGSEAAPSYSWGTNYSNLTTFYDPEFDLAVDELVGYTLRNLSTGGEGVITGNKETTITVAALTGGTRATFLKDDIIEILDVPESFVFSEVAWEPRKVGSLELDPMPYFVGRRASTIFYHRGRLGITAGDFVSMSASGNPRNFFRASVAAVLDSDPINVKPTRPLGTFHAAISLDDRLFLMTDAAQYELGSGDGLLTPASIHLRKNTDYRSAPQCDWVELGRKAGFIYDHFGNVQVGLYGALPEATRTYEADTLTRDVSRYLSGKAKQIVGFDSIGMLFVLTDDAVDGIGMPGMSADPYYALSSVVIPPTPPSSPPPPSADGEGDVSWPVLKDAEILVGAETLLDEDGFTTDSFDDNETLTIDEGTPSVTTEALPEDTVLSEVSDTSALTDGETKEDSTVAPEVYSASVTYSNYGDGGPPKHLSQPGSAAFSFYTNYAESVKADWYDFDDTLVATETVDTTAGVAAGPWTTGAFDASSGAGTYYCRLTPYTGDGATGTAGTAVTVYAYGMRSFA